jgi:hypothetical protein
MRKCLQAPHCVHTNLTHLKVAPMSVDLDGLELL